MVRILFEQTITLLLLNIFYLEGNGAVYLLRVTASIAGNASAKKKDETTSYLNRIKLPT